jgi:hypothetical protein
MFKDMLYCSFYDAVSTAYCVLYNRTLDVKNDAKRWKGKAISVQV